MSKFLLLQFKTTQDYKALPEAEDSNVKSACNGEEVNLRFQETSEKCSCNRIHILLGIMMQLYVT